MSNQTSGLLELHQVSVVQQAANGPKQILASIDLTINKGEIVTIIGPNGAGKTTLLHVLLGLIPPTSGKVYQSTDIKFGYMPQKINLNPLMPLTVERFLQLAVSQPNQTLSSKIESILAEVGASRLKHERINILSGGELQRIMLAYALMNEPTLLVLDEPAQGVDVVGQVELYKLIAKIRDERGCSVVLVSHDLHLVMGASDRVICLNGHVCCSGHPDHVQGHPSYKELFQPLLPYTHHHDHRHDQGCDGDHKC